MAAAGIADRLEHERARLDRLRTKAEAAHARSDAATPGGRKGWYIRDRHGWHRVVRVSAKSFSVETGYSWTDRIARDRVIETRAPKAA